MTYAIFVKPHFYAGTLNVRKPGIMFVNGYAVALEEKGKADALCSMLSDNGDDPNVLSYGQYAETEYSVVKSSAKAQKLEDLMFWLGLHLDFNPDGSKIPFVDDFHS